MLLRSLKNSLRQQGFSLLELTVTMGLMGLVSLFTIKIMEQQSMSQQSIEASAEINTMVSNIAQAINDPVKCNSMFYNKAAGNTFPGLSYQIVRPGLPTVTHRLVETLADHNKIYQDFYIKDSSSIVLQYEPATGTARLDVTFHVQPLGTTQKANLYNNPNAKTIKRSIPFNVVLSTANRVMYCGPVISSNAILAKQAACSALKNVGGWWNPSTNRCEIVKQSCPFNRVFRGFTVDGSGKVIPDCQPASNYVKAEDIFDLGHSMSCVGKTKWKFIVGPNNKLRLNCE